MARTFAVWKLKQMAVERVSSVRVRGIAPYTLDRMEGEVQINAPARGTMGMSRRRWVPCKAYDLRHPDGSFTRFATLREARHAGAMAAAERRKGVTA
jgi:hypothetical protein